MACNAAVAFRLEPTAHVYIGLRLNHGRIYCFAGEAGAAGDLETGCSVSRSPLTVLDIRLMYHPRGNGGFPLLQVILKKIQQISQQKHPFEPRQGLQGKKMIMFGTLGSGRQEGEF